jgi:hypothetical protein
MADVFTWQPAADGRVRVFWRGREVTVLTGARAATFLRRVTGVDAEQAQLVMARATGNFKRGNERTGKRSPRS